MHQGSKVTEFVVLSKELSPPRDLLEFDRW